MKSTETSSPTGNSGATSLPPIGNSFMQIEISFGNSNSDNNFCSFERNDIIQKTNKTFCSNSFSILYNNSLIKLMGRFRNQLQLNDNTWSTQPNT